MRASTSLCGDLDPVELARVEARLRKAFTFERSASNLIVDFGCDAATQTVQDLFYDDGSGHGGKHLPPDATAEEVAALVKAECSM